MTVGGRLEVPGYSRDQIGQILRSLELAGSARTMAYREAPEEDSAAIYRSGSGNPDHRVNRPDVLHNEGGSS
jgi:hypothetical protein